MISCGVRLVILVVAAVPLGGIAGCSRSSSFEFDALDRLPQQDALAEFSLGKYNIPIPVVEDRGKSRLAYQNRFQFGFELHALISPAEESELSDAWTRHEGKIRDQVIRICRSTTVEEFQEPELSTLKARLAHALAGQIGEKDIRQLLITEIVSQEI